MGTQTAKKRTTRKSGATAATSTYAITPDDARRLADLFEAVADAMREWRARYADSLETEQIRQLRNLQLTILHSADSLTTVAVGVVLDEAAISLRQLQAATEKARDAVATIKTVTRTVEVAASTISLAAAVAAKDVKGAARAAAALLALVNDEV